MNAQQTKQKGFTIIEVVLVLAIAGLIFLMVFIALPTLQRSQRDAARKTEAGTVVSAIGTFQGNARGKNPTTPTEISKIVNGNTTGVLDSGANVYIVSSAYTSARTLTPNLNIAATSDNTIAPDEVNVFFGYKCGTTNTSLVKGTARQAAVAVIQESGNGTVYCTNS